MPRKPEPIKQMQCSCGQLLGEETGNWFTYPNPLICTNCGRDNTDRIRDHILRLAK